MDAPVRVAQPQIAAEETSRPSAPPRSFPAGQIFDHAVRSSDGDVPTASNTAVPCGIDDLHRHPGAGSADALRRSGLLD